MMDKYQVVLGAIAVSIMVLVPVLCVLSYDLLAGRWDRGIAVWRERRQEAREHRRSVRALRRQAGLPLEDVVANLRRLRVAVGGDARRSAAHQMGNRLAYDRLLAQACEMLDIEHELSAETAGMERDIERVRIEAELEGAGVYVTDRHFGQAA
jgi:hypothetical protein